MAQCIVCSSGSATYRCRHCRSFYCCSSCFKQHRDGEGAHSCSHIQRECQAQGDGLDCVGERQAEPCPSASGGVSPLVAVISAEPGLAGGAEGQRKAEEDYFTYGRRDEDGVLSVLGQAHLTAISHNQWVRDQLKSVELQRLMRIIDNSRSRIDALEAGLANIPDFKAFCDGLLKVLAEADESFKPKT
uniref:HIT-type domain-containing protein n=1 Tax=Trypanosoma congolense (strain IL3000) TaxID=1068625 RepID=G0UZQ4_TRYCI|nr:conserved hypothetical protein [Trypanosoma congolense IL3000]